MELTREQIGILEDTFNYAVNALEEEKEKPSTMFIMHRDGTCEKFDIDKKIKDICDLWEIIKKEIKVRGGANDGKQD